jgi:hypothetical protein
LCSIQWEKAIKQSIDVKNNQPAQGKSSDQETKDQTKMILSDEDLVKVVLFRPNALKRV